MYIFFSSSAGLISLHLQLLIHPLSFQCARAASCASVKLNQLQNLIFSAGLLVSELSSPLWFTVWMSKHLCQDNRRENKMAGMRSQDALTGQRLSKILETVKKPFTPSHVGKAQRICIFPFVYLKNSLLYIYILKDCEGVD